MIKQAVTALAALFLLASLPQPVAAQEDGLQALARVDQSRSSLSDDGTEVVLQLGLSQPVPYRVFVLADPNRVVIDFREVDWSGFDGPAMGDSAQISGLRYGIFRPGWSRLVLELKEPMKTRSVELIPNRTRGTADLSLRLEPTTQTAFRAAAKAHQDDAWALPKATEIGQAKPRQLGDRPLVVVLDPGHGGIDGGAERGGYQEKELVLQFAKELQEALIRSGRYKVELTRTDDVFLSLPARVTRARQLNADVFISIHADALSEGTASGTTVYTISPKASSAMAEELAESHDRSDLLAGVDLSQQDDQIAAILMDMARLETDQRSDLLAEMLVDGIADAIGRIRKRPHLSAGFTVLKAPDIPSVLVELGFMSNRQDLSNLLTPGWRDQVIAGITDALDRWTIEDAAQARLLRK
ncbi:MAG: N-acetylmuramoyl-L-alanine amidase [Pseudomonadota bacterium]